MTLPMNSERELHERLDAVRCLKNAHGHIATAYAHFGDPPHSPGSDRRAIRETLDAVDWLRRALEHMEATRAAS